MKVKASALPSSDMGQEARLAVVAGLLAAEVDRSDEQLVVHNFGGGSLRRVVVQSSCGLAHTVRRALNIRSAATRGSGRSQALV